MKKIIIAVAIALGASALIGAPANAINSNACNQGTYRAAHINYVTSPGIMRIGYFCHGL